MLIASLVLASILVFITVVIHLTGLSVLMALMRARFDHIRPHASFFRQAIFLGAIVLGLFGLHALQIWVYALVYLALGEFSTFEAALYYSTSAFTTVGFGDVFQESEWRMIGAIESANGFLMIGWSTAFLVTVIGKLRAAEFDWLEHREQRSEKEM